MNSQRKLHKPHGLYGESILGHKYQSVLRSTVEIDHELAEFDLEVLLRSGSDIAEGSGK